MQKKQMNPNREVVEMPIDAIGVDRWPHDAKTFVYAQLMYVGIELPPIKVFKRDGRWWISDGRHRLLAHKLLGKKTIWVRRATKEAIERHEARQDRP